MGTKKAKAIIESILFTMGESVAVSKLSDALETGEEEVRWLARELMREYEQEERGLRVIELEDSFQMCSAAEMYEYLIRIAKQPKKHVLTDVVLETLSIVAYKQPVTRQEIEKIRGVSCEHAVNKLMEYGLICELGRLDGPGRPILFGTSEEFLRCFGVSSLDDLPVLNPDQLEEFKQEVADEMRIPVEI